ncbi:MAG: glycine--tRNA ligase subunit beta [Woeseiaceae bacterium]|nr:glycine--tRNA ligase subunit beta [Woeseiaceae bacterium]
MTKAADFLVEIGTEELPPKALRSLMEAFASDLEAAVDEARLGHGNVHGYASPRRLAVLIEDLELAQEDRKSTQKGPPVKVAFDDDGNPTPAAMAFAKKCGVEVDALGREKTDKGEWLVSEVVEKGRKAAELVPELIDSALAGLPIPRRMRWGAGDAEFVRPVHWVVLLHGKETIAASIMGVTASNESVGHRFHTSGPVAIASPGDYLETLEKKGHVIADFERRLAMVRDGVTKAADSAGGTAVGDDDLYDEVTALVEWPVPIVGSFDEQYLELPREAVVSTLTSHQRYFPVADKDGKLLAKFVTVANLDSKDPNQVRDGNERVIRPRLADAAFFWDSDRRIPLSARAGSLREVVYQRGLGSLHDKAVRVADLGATIADLLEHNPAPIRQAAMLAKCDLVTGMVGEFPELQGIMGRYYALSDKEPAEVADPIAEHYLPRFAGDELPASINGQVLAVADRLDTLAGVFAIGKKPSGNRDPFGLRRAALGIIRVLIECGLDLDLKALIASAVDMQPGVRADGSDPNTSITADVYGFITDRLRRYFLDRDESLATETFDAVLARSPLSLVDFERRLAAVQAFVGLEPAASLAAANKRIANILRQAEVEDAGEVKKKLLAEPAEIALEAALEQAIADVAPMLYAKDYTDALTALAELREPVDTFFDDVMVNVDDKATRNNRLALLSQLRALFLDVADISRLSI